jgi:adenylate cyclase
MIEDLAGASLGIAAVAIIVYLHRKGLQREAQLATAMQRLEMLQVSFSRFAPEGLVDDIVVKGISVEATKREVTILFADVQGFTAMSERLDPSEVVDILNGYFCAMSVAITDHNGHVSKFIGDGILAVFGALQTNPWQAKDAVDAALEMRVGLERYNNVLREQGRVPLAIGIGVHKGEVVAGVIGSAQLLEYTVIGDAVNTAARVEGLTRTHGVDILVTESVQACLSKQYAIREFPPVKVKGKAAPIITFAIEAGPPE